MNVTDQQASGHLITRLLDEEAPFDWSDIQTSGRRGARILDQLAEDPDWLGGLLRRVADDERLLSMCERHTPFDKIVIYDAADRKFRIRLHIWRLTDHERAHQHRFSFTARMLQGQYRHILYDTRALAAVSGESGEEHLHTDPNHADAGAGIDLDRISPVLAYDLRAGDGYTLHHDAIHATIVESQAVSLILRGPAEKKFAFVANLDNRGVYWRFGRRDESVERVRSKQLPREELLSLLGDLAGRGIITAQ